MIIILFRYKIKITESVFLITLINVKCYSYIREGRILKKFFFILIIIFFTINVYPMKNSRYYNSAIIGTWHTKKFGIVMYFANKGDFEIRIARRLLNKKRAKSYRALPPIIKKGKWKLNNITLKTSIKSNSNFKRVKYKVLFISRHKLKLRVINKKKILVFYRFFAPWAQANNTDTELYKKRIKGKWQISSNRLKAIFEFTLEDGERKFNKTVYLPGDKKTVYQGSWSVYSNILRISGGGYRHQGYYIFLEISDKSLVLLGGDTNPVVFSKVN